MDATETDTGEREERVGTIAAGDTSTGTWESVFKVFCNPYFEYDEDISKHDVSNAHFEIKP